MYKSPFLPRVRDISLQSPVKLDERHRLCLGVSVLVISVGEVGRVLCPIREGMLKMRVKGESNADKCSCRETSELHGFCCCGTRYNIRGRTGDGSLGKAIGWRCVQVKCE